jgi:hypothetical protein
MVVMKQSLVYVSRPPSDSVLSAERKWKRCECHAFAAKLQNLDPVFITAKACRICKICMLSR